MCEYFDNRKIWKSVVCCKNRCSNFYETVFFKMLKKTEKKFV